MKYQFLYGSQYLWLLEESKKWDRRYTLKGDVSFIISWNGDKYRYDFLEGFMFDGRSGSPLLDWFAPNLGNIEERLAWLCHDANGYATLLSFKETNKLLYDMLVELCYYWKIKAKTIQCAVSVSDSWYGEPKPGTWYCENKGKFFISKL